MKKLLTFLLTSLLCFASYASKDSMPNLWVEDEETFDVLPEYKGGVDALFKWLNQHVTYPEQAISLGVGGEVYVGLTIKEDGSIANVHIKKGLYPVLDAEVMRAFSAMPKWNPAMEEGTAVESSVLFPMSVSFLPIPFKVDYSLLDKEDLSDMLNDAFLYLLSKKHMGDLMISKGKSSDNKGEITLDITLKQKPQWWDDAAENDVELKEKLLGEIISPFAMDFRANCMENGVSVKCSVKPDKNTPPYDFEIKGDALIFVNPEYKGEIWF